MDDKDIADRIKEILIDLTNIKKTKITITSSLENDLGIDSFTALEILAAIEQDFDIVIRKEKISTLRTFQDVLELVKNILKKNNK